MQPLSCLLLQRHSLHPRLSFQPGAAVANEVKVCQAPELKSLNHVVNDAPSMNVVLRVSEISAKRIAAFNASSRGFAEMTKQKLRVCCAVFCSLAAALASSPFCHFSQAQQWLMRLRYATRLS